MVEVGDGATHCLGSDKYPYTVVSVKTYQSGQKKGEVREIVLQEDRAIRTDNGGYFTENQEYKYERNIHGRALVATNTVHGFRVKGTTQPVIVGWRRRYNDPSF